MKKILSGFVLLAIVFMMAGSTYAQMADDDRNVVRQESSKMEDRWGKKDKKIGGRYFYQYFDPQKVAAYNEDEFAVWREMKELNLKKELGLFLAIGSALAIAIAAFGGAIAQGKVAAAAMEGIARNPEASGKIFTPLIISLALIESLVIYALVIAFMLQGKL